MVCGEEAYEAAEDKGDAWKAAVVFQDGWGDEPQARGRE